MLARFHQLRRLLDLWRSEHARVVDAAAVSNLERVRWLSAVIASLNGLVVLVMAAQLSVSPANAQTHRWQVALLLAHAGMGLAMVACGVASHRFRHASRTRWGYVLPRLVVALGMLFSIAVAVIDQWVTPNITPFLIGCTVISVAIYIRPLIALYIYVASYAVFFVAMGWTQANATLLLSNRLNGVAACIMGWALSVMLWRKFTTIKLQQMQLEASNLQLQDKQRELERLTRSDGLTGLFNRNTFVELAENELNRAQRQGTATAILLMDLDYFKRINDTWGHPAGDTVLRHAALVTSSSVRSTDLVGRLGGEEFMVLLPATSLEGARRAAETVRRRMEANPARWNGLSIPVTVSIGVTGTTASQKRDFDNLYHDADQALYAAKQQGRNRVVAAPGA